MNTGQFPASTGLFYLCHGPREGDPNNMQTLETVYFPKLLQVLSDHARTRYASFTVHLWMDPRYVSQKTIAYKIGFLKRLVEKAQNRGLTVCIENLSEHCHRFGRSFCLCSAS